MTEQSFYRADRIEPEYDADHDGIASLDFAVPNLPDNARLSRIAMDRVIDVLMGAVGAWRECDDDACKIDPLTARYAIEIADGLRSIIARNAVDNDHRDFEAQHEATDAVAAVKAMFGEDEEGTDGDDPPGGDSGPDLPACA